MNRQTINKRRPALRAKHPVGQSIRNCVTTLFYRLPRQSLAYIIMLLIMLMSNHTAVQDLISLIKIIRGI